MSKIPTSTTVKYILSQEVQVSVEELTDTEILKLTKPELQIATKQMRFLLLGYREKYAELEKMISDPEVLRIHLANLTKIENSQG